MPLYKNIRKSGITKATKRPELFPFDKVIGCILPRAEPATMIISNTEGKYFVSFTPTYIARSCKLPIPQVMMTDKWVKKVVLDIVECAK